MIDYQHRFTWNVTTVLLKLTTLPICQHLMITETEMTTKSFIITTSGTTCKPRSIHFWRASWRSKLCKLKGLTRSVRLEDVLWAMAKTWGYCWCSEGPWSSRQLWVLLLITIDWTLTPSFLWVCGCALENHLCIQQDWCVGILRLLLLLRLLLHLLRLLRLLRLQLWWLLPRECTVYLYTPWTKSTPQNGH